MFYVWCYVLKLSLRQIFSSVSYIVGIHLCILNKYRFKLGILIVLFNSRVWIYWLWIVILNLKFLFCKFIHLFFWFVMRILLFLLMYAKRKKQSPDLTQRDASKEEFGRRVLAGGNMWDSLSCLMKLLESFDKNNQEMGIASVARKMHQKTEQQYWINIIFWHKHRQY